MPIASCPFPWASLRRLWLHLLSSSSLFPIRYFYTLLRSSLSFLFFRMNNPGSLSFSLYVRCSSALIIFVALCWTHSSMPIVLGNPELDTALQIRSDQWWVETKNHIPWPAGNTFLVQARRLLAAFAIRAHCRLMFNLVFLKTVFFCEAASQPVLHTGAWGYSFAGVGLCISLW